MTPDPRAAFGEGKSRIQPDGTVRTVLTDGWGWNLEIIQGPTMRDDEGPYRATTARPLPARVE